jgi:menaquinone-dependent protoporphyrinogen oxidase
MRVLVTAASKHGSTIEIAQRVGDQLAAAGLEANVMPAEAVQDFGDYDAVVLGSAIYAGQWLGSAKDLVRRHGRDLMARPVWLFSSGPIGDPPKPHDDPVDAAGMVAATGARGHRVFPGLLDRGRLSFGERAIVVALRAPYGDFRDWDAVREWSAEIAESLRTPQEV